MARTPALMFQGTGSHVGKSLLVAGLCRVMARRGISVAPFKPQNMSNNAAVAEDGGEIGRAQALQARAAKRAASVHMNPILLKPESESGAQLVVQGKRRGSIRAIDYGSRKGELLGAVLESFAEISKNANLLLIEGAGSPAETNLRAGDIANMGFAEAADIPVVIIGDIDRGGVIASLVGTHAVLSPKDRDRIKGFLVNKFRGDAALFRSGAEEIARRTGWAHLGLLPWFDSAHLLPAEDALGLVRSATAPRAGQLRIAVPLSPRIANFDDLDPLRQEEGVALLLVRPGEPIPLADLIILPGSKATIEDLAFFRAQGWDIDLLAHARRGGAILGLCGGYQMLGKSIADPGGIEGSAQQVAGLGLLDIDTELTNEKTTLAVAGTHVASGLAIAGYEIHAGISQGLDNARPFIELGERLDGAISANGRVFGTYVHGIFSGDEFRAAFLKSLGGEGGHLAFESRIEATLDRLADHLEANLPIERLLAIARAGR